MSLFMHTAGKKKGGLLFFLSHRKNIPEELKKTSGLISWRRGGGGRIQKVAGEEWLTEFLFISIKK